ncbi:MAG: hypothetical protein DME18_06870 [Verrucomicrobia bacterium]|nr:MAG: hypothetical protein DME18_06870 [Verrucomicrobiota bacterium]
MKALNDKRGERLGGQPLTRLIAGGLLAVALAAVLVPRSRQSDYRGKSISAWVQELGDNSYAARLALREIGPEAISTLIRALEGKPAAWLNAYAVVVDHSPRFLRPTLAGYFSDIARRDSRVPRIRVAAAQVLGDFGPVAGKATGTLVKALSDRNPILWLNAAFALGKIGAQPELAVPALTGLLSDSNDEVRMYAAIALKRFGPRAAHAVPALIATLNDRSWQVRERAALALGAVGRNQSNAVLALKEAMRDEHRFVRSSAATALVLLAPHAKTARSALEQASYDPDAEVRHSAALAVSQIDSEAGTQAGLK